MCFSQLAFAKTFELKPTSCAQNLEFVPHNLRLVNSYVYNLWWKPWTQHVKNTLCPCKLEGCVFTTCTTLNLSTQPTSCAQNLEFVLHNLRLVDSYVYNLWWKPRTQHMKKDCIIHRWLHNFWPKPWTQPHNSHPWIMYPLANYTMVLLMTLLCFIKGQWHHCSTICSWNKESFQNSIRNVNKCGIVALVIEMSFTPF
jgi:hypothetical protein